MIEHRPFFGGQVRRRKIPLFSAFATSSGMVAERSSLLTATYGIGALFCRFEICWFGFRRLRIVLQQVRPDLGRSIPAAAAVRAAASPRLIASRFIDLLIEFTTDALGCDGELRIIEFAR